jgi:ectoine hydroxylase-related dioxygenase (phytanoyl-CoA dioxygenase family)
VNGAFASLVGDDYVYLGSDGNFYSGDTTWHSDSDWGVPERPSRSLQQGQRPRPYIKMAIYLDPVVRETGSLRVIPGSHNWGDGYADGLHNTLQAHLPSHPEAADSKDFGHVASQSEIPSVALESSPGDVVVFIQACKHASFGGTSRRRMFTINCTPRYDGADGAEVLRREMAGQAGAYRSDVYEGEMIVGATESRMVHLRQVIEQRDFFMEQIRAGGERLAALPEPLADQARWSLEVNRGERTVHDPL